MMISRQTTKIATLIAIIAIAGFFIYKGVAGPMKIITTGTASVKINTPETNKLTSGLVGYWTFDGPDTNWTSATAGTVTDRSGNSNTGTFPKWAGSNMSRSTSPVIGKVGQGMYFSGLPNSMSTPLGVGPGSATVSAWVYSKASGGGIVSNYYCGSEFDFDSGFSLDFQIDGSNKLVNYQGADGSYWCSGITSNTSTDLISLNQWQHVVFVRNNSNQITFYINGVQDSGGWQSSGEVGNSPSGISIFESGGGSSFLNGSIDEVRIYNRALSASEITELYNQGQVKINASQADKLTSGLVGYWTFDGPDTDWGVSNTFTDLSGQGNHGTTTTMSTSTSPVPGKIGQAMYFDGSDNRITVLENDSLDFGTADFSATVWIKTSTVTNRRGIIDKVPNNDGNNFHVLLSGAGKINFMIHDAGTDYSLTSNLSVNDGQWHHIGVVVDWSTFPSGTAYIYIDGSEDKKDTTNLPIYVGTSLSNSYNLTIGDAPYAASYEFLGSIDEVRLYNRALSAAEVWELYKQGI